MSDLSDLTRAALASQDPAAGLAAGFEMLPWLGASIHRDRTAGRFARWGLSTVIDENTGAPVISRPLFDDLHRRAGLRAVWPVGNAGLVHCYGYLLSLAETPYGLKRDRWIAGALASACGLPSDAFHPWTSDSTLLARASAAASALLSTPAASATAEIDGRATRVALSVANGPAALAYTVAPRTGAAPLLVTLFPVAEASVPLGAFTTDPRLRWNAV
ncbi:amino acid deaminase [Microbacterium sp. 179-I 3D4 NHS]|uniref:amino acid deaminase n=1 Tax=Microbacterium sp. 179-I 3D4 NHS TaxID=3142381 RepID=UPI00399F6769